MPKDKLDYITLSTLSVADVLDLAAEYEDWFRETHTPDQVSLLSITSNMNARGNKELTFRCPNFGYPLHLDSGYFKLSKNKFKMFAKESKYEDHRFTMDIKPTDNACFPRLDSINRITVAMLLFWRIMISDIDKWNKQRFNTVLDSTSVPKEDKED